MDEFVERLIAVGGILGTIGLPLGIAGLVFAPGEPGTNLALGAGAIGVIIFLVASLLDNRFN